MSKNYKKSLFVTWPVFFVLFVELGVFFFWGTCTFLARLLLLLSLLLLNPTVVEAVVEAVVVVEEQDE